MLSHPAPIIQGVPQGSCLSPDLFNFYLEPLTTILKHAGIAYRRYADDIQLYIKISNADHIRLLNETLPNV